MRRRQFHRLDMLPLLDVFMVVLFVFASIQETAHETVTQRSERLVAELERTANEGSQVERRLRAQLETAESAKTRAQDEAARRRAEAETSKAALAMLRERAEAATERVPENLDEALRQQEVLSKLLDHFSVFEIEIAGVADDSGAVTNTCCYRADLDASGWISCGTVPAPLAEVEDWLEDGAAGLLDALRRTKGGNAMTLIRQDETATYRIASTLEAGLRSRFPDHKLYNEGVALERNLCPRLSLPSPR